MTRSRIGLSASPRSVPCVVLKRGSARQGGQGNRLVGSGQVFAPHGPFALIVQLAFEVMHKSAHGSRQFVARGLLLGEACCPESSRPRAHLFVGTRFNETSREAR